MVANNGGEIWQRRRALAYCLPGFRRNELGRRFIRCTRRVNAVTVGSRYAGVVINRTLPGDLNGDGGADFRIAIFHLSLLAEADLYL